MEKVHANARLESLTNKNETKDGFNFFFLINHQSVFFNVQMSDCVLQSVYCKHCNIVQVHQWAAAHVGWFSVGRIVINKEQPLITSLVMKLYLGNTVYTIPAH